MEQVDNQNQYLKLKMNEQSILLPLQHVKIVLRLPALQEVPHEAKGFEGILNYHGTSVPVYSLANWIGTDSIEYTLDTPLVLCELQGELLGLLVSDVSGVVYVKPDEVQLPKFSNLPNFVKGAYESEHESMWVIHLNDLIGPKEKLMSTISE